MGMDVIGKNEQSEIGKYFRNNVWWWHPLASYCQEVAPDICNGCQNWHSNDGDGLGAKGAVALAIALQAEVTANRTHAYALRYTSANESKPNIQCEICAGTGTRLPVPYCGAGNLVEGGLRCNGCDGQGYVRPHSSHYPFSVENVVAFIAFLRECNGFEIC